MQNPNNSEIQAWMRPLQNRVHPYQNCTHKNEQGIRKAVCIGKSRMTIYSYKHHFSTVNPKNKLQIPKVLTVTKIQIRSVNYQRT